MLEKLNPELIVRQEQGPNSRTRKKLNPELILAGVCLVREAIISRFNCLSTSGLRKQLIPDLVLLQAPKEVLKPSVRRFAVFVSVPHLGSSTTINP